MLSGQPGERTGSLRRANRVIGHAGIPVILIGSLRRSHALDTHQESRSSPPSKDLPSSGGRGEINATACFRPHPPAGPSEGTTLQRGAWGMPPRTFCRYCALRVLLYTGDILFSCVSSRSGGGLAAVAPPCVDLACRPPQVVCVSVRRASRRSPCGHGPGERRQRTHRGGR